MPAQQQPNSAIMPYFEETVVPSAAVTASGNGSTLSGYGRTKSIRAALIVTAASGTTPTLLVTIEDTLDGINWFTVGTFTSKTAAATEAINISGPYADRVRVKWVVGGTTPSFTFKVDFATEVEPA